MAAAMYAMTSTLKHGSGHKCISDMCAVQSLGYGVSRWLSAKPQISPNQPQFEAHYWIVWRRPGDISSCVCSTSTNVKLQQKETFSSNLSVLFFFAETYSAKHLFQRSGGKHAAESQFKCISVTCKQCCSIQPVRISFWLQAAVWMCSLVCGLTNWTYVAPWKEKKTHQKNTLL